MTKLNGSTDLNETHVNCDERYLSMRTEGFIQLGLSIKHLPK